MGFDRNYDALIALAADMAQYESGYLDSDGEKIAQQARVAYATARNKIAYDILAEKPELDLVYDRIRSDLASIGQENEGFEDLCSFVAEDLIDKLQEESQKSGAWRMTKRYAGPAVLAVLGIAYVTMFFVNDLTVDQSIESREGLVQYAAAYDKARSYDDMMDTRSRRGGFLKGILLWPWEPDDEEMVAAEEFAGLALGGLQAMTQDGMVCNTQYLLSEQGEFLSEGQLGFVDSVAEHVLDESTQWQDPPVMTPFAMMMERYACPVDPNGVAPAQ